MVLLAEKTERSKPCHSSDEFSRGKEFDTSTNYVCFFPQTFKKRICQGFPYGNKPFVTDFCSLLSQVKYKTSEIKRTYLYIKIFGGVSCYFSKFTKCQLSIWSGAIFNQTQLKNRPGVSLRVANPLSLNFCSSVFRVQNIKPNSRGLVFQNL